MIKWALRRAIGKFERNFNYDASYMRDMIDASPRAAWLFSRVTTLGQLLEVPIDMLTIVLIGNQSSRFHGSWIITPRGYLGFQ